VVSLAYVCRARRSQANDTRPSNQQGRADKQDRLASHSKHAIGSTIYIYYLRTYYTYTYYFYCVYQYRYHTDARYHPTARGAFTAEKIS
jgi:hypothetical protein